MGGGVNTFTTSRARPQAAELFCGLCDDIALLTVVTRRQSCREHVGDLILRFVVFQFDAPPFRTPIFRMRFRPVTA